MPSRNPVVDWEPWKSMGIHKVLVDNFVIFYTVADDNHIVTIIRIVYGGRDIKGLASETRNDQSKDGGLVQNV